MGLKYLINLQLAGNSLTSPLPRLPESLQVLNLESNQLYNISQPFGTPNLQQLLLTKNCYYANPCNRSFHIDEAVFRELTQLRHLSLGFTNVTSILPGLPPSLTWLDLNENKIAVLDGWVFPNLTQLKYLNLGWNCQRCDHAAQPCFPCANNASLKISPSAFYAQNNSLIYLSLRGNSLRNIPKGLFGPLVKLRRLDLSDNLLAYAIRNGTFFEELRHLTWISLIYNYEPMKTFTNLILSPKITQMSRLQNLLLSGNFFQTISPETLELLSKLRQLEILELRMNFMRSCNLSGLAQLPALKKVDLSQNQLQFLRHCSMPLLPGLHEVHATVDLQNQPMMLHDQRAIGEEPLDPMSQIVTVAKQGPNSANIQNILYTQTPSLCSFRDRLCKNNTYFDISQNNILTLNSHLFLGMENAVCLDLSYNYISQSLDGHQFTHLDNLNYLSMAHNRIDLYYKSAFQELNNTLKVLDLSNNEFHFLMRGMGHRLEFIQYLYNLEALSLSDNSIGMRIDHTLYSNSLRYLYFAGNNLGIMWDTRNSDYITFFQKLTTLIYLDISRNHLRSLSPEVLCNLPVSLQALQVSDNHLKFFPWNNITVLGNLTHLNLSVNRLSDLPNKVILFGANFTLLDLSYNLISVLPEDFFSMALTLRFLYLNHNNLKLLDRQSLPAPLRTGSALQILTLHANPFDCSCDTSWFADYLRASQVEIPRMTTNVNCGFPESKQGESVLSMDPRSCQEIYGSLTFLCMTFLTLMFTALPLLKHLYGWDVWYCFQVLWAGHKGYSHLPGGNSQSEYDAFVVFDTGNQAVRDWIYNELLVQLENMGRRKFRLCLEERDWVPGLSCIENLHSAVYHSMKTVFVLTSGCGGSGGGAASVNGVTRQAFYMVQQRLLDEKVDVAVLVLLDKVFPKLKYLQLRKRLCRKSVLSWPRNPKAQPLFWNRITTALASDNISFYDRNISESFI
ncbi:toll-like receptor 9 isoform X2 [Esox lucius]|nr:toll-like receptor 9 isoform X2 [Esox lucius]